MCTLQTIIWFFVFHHISFFGAVKGIIMIEVSHNYIDLQHKTNEGMKMKREESHKVNLGSGATVDTKGVARSYI